MKRVKWYVAVAVAVLAFPMAVFAQAPANELGVFVSTSSFDSTQIFDEETGTDLAIEFDEKIGYGVSYNRYWLPRFSTELALQSLGGDVQVTFVGPPRLSVDAGEISLTAFTATAQWHFLESGKFDPYIGGGVAYVTGDVDFVDDPDFPDASTNVDLESEVTWLANGGIFYRVTDSIAIGADVKYIAYEPKAEDDPSNERVDINPLVFSAGVKFRF